jgi:hypothetical protein
LIEFEGFFEVDLKKNIVNVLEIDWRCGGGWEIDVSIF